MTWAVPLVDSSSSFSTGSFYNNSPIKDSLPANGSINWEELGAQAKALENEVDVKLASLGRLISASTLRKSGIQQGGNPMVQADQHTIDIDSLLQQLATVIDSMSTLLEEVGTSQQHTAHHMLSRHRDIYFEYSREFKRAKTQFQSAREHVELLSSVRDEMGAFGRNGMDAKDYLLNESGRIDTAHGATEHVIKYKLKYLSIRARHHLVWHMMRGIELPLNEASFKEHLVECRSSPVQFYND